MKPNIKDALAGLESLKPEKQLKIARDPNLEHVVSELHKIFAKKHEKIRIAVNSKDISDNLELLAGLDITPDAIERFCYELAIHETRDEFSYEAGPMIGLAVQASFNAGHNKFYLPVSHFESELNYLCNKLSGTEEKKLELTIEGNFNRSLENIEFIKLLIRGNVFFVADNARSCEIELIGNIGDEHGIGSGAMRAINSKIKINGDITGKLFGAYSNGCIFEVTGKSIGNCGTAAMDSKFIFHQNAGHGSAQFSRGCEYIIMGWNNDWRIGSGSHNCTFKCKSEAAIEELKRTLPDAQLGLPRGNKVYRINPDNSETLVAEI